MKTEKKLLSIAAGLILLSITLLSSAAVLLINQEHSKAIVKQQEGMLIFISCTPASDYDVLGTVKVGGVVMSNANNDLLSTLLKRAKKEYATGEGIIMNDLEFTKVDVIKFK